MYVLHTTTTTKTVYDGLSGTCIVLQAGLWKQWAKKFPRLWKWFGEKFSKILVAIEQGIQNFGYFSKQSFNNFGIIATNKVSSASWKQRIVLTIVQKWFRNQGFQISFFFLESFSNNYCPWKHFGNDAIIITFSSLYNCGQWLLLYEITTVSAIRSNGFEMWISYTLVSSSFASIITKTMSVCFK